MVRARKGGKGLHNVITGVRASATRTLTTTDGCSGSEEGGVPRQLSRDGGGMQTSPLLRRGLFPTDLTQEKRKPLLSVVHH